MDDDVAAEIAALDAILNRHELLATVVAAFFDIGTEVIDRCEVVVDAKDGRRYMFDFEVDDDDE